MNFDEIYEKYKNGTASEDEKKFIEQEIEKSKKLNSILNTTQESAITDQAIVKQNTKKASAKARLKTAVCFITVFCVLMGIYLGISFYSASDAVNVTKEQAEEYAKESVSGLLNAVSENVNISECTKKIDFDFIPTNAKYFYIVDVKANESFFTVEVDSVSGDAKIIGADFE